MRDDLWRIGNGILSNPGRNGFMRRSNGVGRAEVVDWFRIGEDCWKYV